MGTFWYHAHLHGSSALQVGGGLAGMLFIDPADNYSLPSDLHSLYNSDAVFELIFQGINFKGNDTGVSDAFTMMDYQAS